MTRPAREFRAGVLAAAGRFRLAGPPVAAAPLGRGHVHRTYLVTTGGERPRSYVLQRLNQTVFPDLDLLAERVAAVTAHQHRRLGAAGCPDPRRRALTVVPSLDGAPMAADEGGRWWRSFVHVEGARSHHRVPTAARAAQVAATAARFLDQVADLPGQPLGPTIPGFRDFERRRSAFEEAATADPHARLAGCRPEVDAVRRHGGVVEELAAACAAGRLPSRVVHNDAKADNVLVDDATGESLCMVDLDTVASGNVLFDFGDVVRSTASSAGEDATAPAPGVDRLAAAAGAYLAVVGELLTAEEVTLLPLGGPLMTYEAALRFLTDHLAGDVYFAVDHPGHNLERAQAQLALLGAMATAREEMAEVVGAVADRVHGR